MRRIGPVLVVALVALTLVLALRGGSGSGGAAATAFAAARRAGTTVEDLLSRTRRALRFWLAQADPATGLVPNFLPSYTLATPKGVNRSGPHFSPADSGADNLPFLVIAAALTDRGAFDAVIPSFLAAERAHATGPDGVPVEAVELTTGKASASSTFAGAEYAKDGLLSITGLLGATPWSERLVEVVVALMEHADVPTRFGMLPGQDPEVHGDLLLVLVPLAWMTRDPRYEAWAKRIADAWFVEVLPRNHGLPCETWDFATHRGNGITRFRDHGNEIIAGLVLYYLLVRDADPERADRDYLPALRTMADRILASANADGLLYNAVDAATLRPPPGRSNLARLSDNWGYVYGALYNLDLATGETRYRDATRRVMERLPSYTNHAWAWQPGHDDFADAIESAIYLLAREDVPGGWEFVTAMMTRLLAFQKADGSIGGSYLDGNWIRTTLLYVLSMTRGATVQPWRPGVALGAVELEGALYVTVSADSLWSGTLHLNRPRHRAIFGMPQSYVRLNEWPEWTTFDEGTLYEVARRDGTTTTRFGWQLVTGVAVTAPDELIIRRAPIP